MTLKQKKFSNIYLESGNATEAAMQAYKPKKRATARSIGSENLTKPNIREYLEEKGTDAAAMIYQLSQKAKNETVRLNASRDILDRVLGKSTQSVQVSNPTELWISDEEREAALRALQNI